jgi:Ankyrin repeat
MGKQASQLQTTMGEQPLHLAANCGYKSTISILVQRCAGDEKIKSPLDLATSSLFVCIEEFLDQILGGNIKAKDNIRPKS